MWIIKWILIAIVVLFILLFAFENQGNPVSIHFIKWQSIELPLYIFLYISFGLGMLFWLLISIFKILKFKGKIRKTQKLKYKIAFIIKLNYSIEKDFK